MKQQCYLWSVWLTWLGLPALAVLVGFSRGWPAGVVVFLAFIAGQLAYLRWFPYLSTMMGYGSVADVPAGENGIGRRAAVPKVALYTANLCPFCPLVRQRLASLQENLEFELEEVDVTFRPELIRAKGLRTVPVVEVDGRFLFGNATSEELAAFLTEAPDHS